MIPVDIPYEALEQFCRHLGHEPANVREIRLRAPRQADVLVYARDEAGGKYLVDDGVALIAYTYQIEVPAAEPETVEAASDA